MRSAGGRAVRGRLLQQQYFAPVPAFILPVASHAASGLTAFAHACAAGQISLPLKKTAARIDRRQAIGNVMCAKKEPNSACQLHD